jgi:hypothetical protein
MNERTESTTPWKKWRVRVGLAVGVLLITVPAVLLLGANAPSIAYLGVFGSVAVSLWPAWLVVLPLAGGALAWACGREKTRRFFAALALLTVLYAATATYRLVALARANGVHMTVTDPFGFSGSLPRCRPMKMWSTRMILARR